MDALIASGALPDPSFLWWDVRLQPALGRLLVLVQTFSELFPRHARDRDMPLLTTAANEDRLR